VREIDADIAWDYWRKLDVWTLEQACRLVYPKDPYSYKTKSSPSAGREIRGHPDTLNRDPRSRPAWANLLHLALAAVRAGTLPHVPVGRRFFVLRPPDFLAWAQEKGVTIPPELEDLLPRPATLQGVSMPREPADIESPRPAGDSHSSQDLNPKSLQSLLKMVIAMAIEGYGFNPEDGRSPIPGEIARDVQKAGLSIDSDTVRRWLRQAAELLRSEQDRT
jgi:hypothetical protein